HTIIGAGQDVGTICPWPGWPDTIRRPSRRGRLCGVVSSFILPRIEPESTQVFGGLMPRHQVSAEAVVDAPAGRAYAVIADYRDGHPHILPRPPFVSLDVEQGGTGAGTVIRFQMRVFGRVRTFRAAITEPEPGRVLAETDLDTGTLTTFTVVPVEDGRK